MRRSGPTVAEHSGELNVATWGTDPFHALFPEVLALSVGGLAVNGDSVSGKGGANDIRGTGNISGRVLIERVCSVAGIPQVPAVLIPAGFGPETIADVVEAVFELLPGGWAAVRPVSLAAVGPGPSLISMGHVRHSKYFIPTPIRDPFALVL